MPAEVPPAPADPSTPAVAPLTVDAVALSCGLRLDEDCWGSWTSPARADGAPVPATIAADVARGALTWLTDHSILRVYGVDAARFLHSQTTNDLRDQPSDVARWHGYCSPKGRLLALMLVWRDGDDFLLMLPRSLVATIRQRLAMFVLRSKVRIIDETDIYAIFGLLGESTRVALSDLLLAAPAAMRIARPAQPTGNDAARAPGGATAPAPDDADWRDDDRPFVMTAIGMPALDAPMSSEAAAQAVKRCLLVVPLAQARTIWTRLAARLVAIDSRLWRWTQIRSGIGSIVPATSEQFVPQMLNLDSEALAAVSFTKGCYPGQEIVARSHYLGKNKRRTFLARLVPADGGAAREPAPGSDVNDASGQPLGVVVMAAPSPDGSIDLLFSAPVPAVESGAATPALRLLPLPYALPVARDAVD